MLLTITCCKENAVLKKSAGEDNATSKLIPLRDVKSCLVELAKVSSYGKIITFAASFKKIPLFNCPTY